MQKLEVFFDYACPYCEKAHTALVALKLKLPTLRVEWRPCEAHPRPDRYGPHSDLCIRGMFFARDSGADLWAYHDRMYRAAVRDRADIENPYVVAQYAEDILDADLLYQALARGVYALELARANDYAYEASDVWAVPACRMDGRRLDAAEDVGVTAGEVEGFVRGV